VAEKFIVSAVSPTSISAGFISDLSAALSKFNLNIQRITNQTPNSSLKSLDIYISSDKDIDDIELKSTVMTLSQKHRVDLAVIKDNVFRYNKRLIVFDMDSTLIQSEVIDELAVLHGVSDQVKEITHKAMNGEIDFNQSLGKRVGLLKGLKKEKALSLMDQIKMTPGTETFLKVVKSLGYKTAVISGGFTLFTEYLRQKYSFDYAFANELEIKDDTLTGNVIPPIVNGEHKAFLLNLISQQESISLEQVVAIGDGANDLPMLSRAGMGIAFHAKEIVKKNAEHNMSFGPMTSILNLLGIPHDYFQQFL
jgi:phosphoserine phosphatase